MRTWVAWISLPSQYRLPLESNLVIFSIKLIHLIPAVQPPLENVQALGQVKSIGTGVIFNLPSERWIIFRVNFRSDHEATTFKGRWDMRKMLVDG